MGNKHLPDPIDDPKREEKLYRLVSRGFEHRRWMPDFEDWANRRVWAERYQKQIVRRLEQYALNHEEWRGLRILDLGSGRGGLSVVLRFAGAEVVGLDLRRRNCRILKLRGSRYGLKMLAVNGLGERLPFREQSFDLVICRDVTEHCQSPRQLLLELRRVLKPDGRAFVTFINRLSWVDPHYYVRGINFLPRPLGEWIIGRAQRKKKESRDRQRLSEMNYYLLPAAIRLSHGAGFEYRDVTLERLREMGAGFIRSFAHRRLSLSRGTFEAVLTPRPMGRDA